MDKNAIKKFAVWARRELLARVSQKAEQYEITNKGYGAAHTDRVSGRLLSAAERKQREALCLRIERSDYEHVMEEAAYTWFNRIIALRFMEVNGYLPTRIRVFTNEENAFKPQILDEAIHMELEGLDMEKVYALKEQNKADELYKYLLITQCNALNAILPGMFQTIADYTELLFPDNLLREGSVIQQMIELIPEEDWREQVQIIGWLYQYYNSEPKDAVFAKLKKNIKISKHDIPAATQLFTPDWIVRYMVENSLGRMWLEGHPDSALQASWRYYLPEAAQEPEVEAQLADIRRQYADLKPEDIKCIDPCMGSGHILCYLFDVLVQIYEAYGYPAREAAKSIVENNLYGLDIDDRAAQLAYFAVMMKARAYDRRFFSRGVQPHVMAIQESNALKAFEHLRPQLSMDTLCMETANSLIRTFKDAKEYGSILDVSIPELQEADRLLEQLKCLQGDFELMAWLEKAEELLPALAKQAVIMQQRYDVVVTNPPYMGASGMGAKLSDYVKANYPDSKSDLFAVFMEKCGEMVKPNGLQAMITQHAWMFLSSFEKLRLKLLQKDTVNMAHLGIGTFEDLNSKVVQSVAFVLANHHIAGYAGSYHRLFEKQGLQENNEEKAQWLVSGKHLFVAKQENFHKIPGSPVAYWVHANAINAFDTGISIDTISDFTGSQHKTADNEKYLRFFWEINTNSILRQSWLFYIKGGEYRKWYGNIDLIVDWSESARSFYASNTTSNMIKQQYWKQEGVTYTSLSSYCNGFRYLPPIGVFDIKGPSIVRVEKLYYCLAFFNSVVANYYLKLLNPTITLQVKDVKNTPIIIEQRYFERVDQLSRKNVAISRADWDSFETSWDFKRHPLIENQKALWDCTSVACTLSSIGIKPIKAMPPLEICYHLWEQECLTRFNTLKANEEELNRIFIDIYGLQDELTPDVADKDVTVRKADLARDIRSLISYAVGCMFGRYSIDIDGLILAGQPFNSRFAHNPMGIAYGDSCQLEGDFISQTENGSDWIPCTFMPDKDGILPISDDEYFTDDIVSRFVQFIEVVYGKDSLEENLKFIADALNGNGSPREVIRNYFLNGFYADHLKIYQKRPIYWLFDSGKKNGFKCLIYMHRYAPDTIARIRTDYVHEQQSRYRTAIHDLENRVASASATERVRLQKQLAKLRDQAEEARIYEEKIHHYADQMIAIDLDDGVKVNYARFEDVLAKNK